MISIEFTGNENFSSTELERALRGEASYLLAIHPHADSTDIKFAAERLLEAGYRNRGFRDVDVSVAPADELGIVTCHLTEGLHYERRDVRIDGCLQIDSDRKTRTADLIVSIIEEGTPNVAHEIRIQGTT